MAATSDRSTEEIPDRGESPDTVERAEVGVGAVEELSTASRCELSELVARAQIERSETETRSAGGCGLCRCTIEHGSGDICRRYESSSRGEPDGILARPTTKIQHPIAA